MLAGWAVVLYLIAAGRYLALARRQPAPLLVAIAASFTLLAEAMIAVTYARNWHASWWEWHVLMAVAFALVTVVTRHEYRVHPAAGAFSSLYLAHTIGRVDARYAGAVEELVGAPTRARWPRATSSAPTRPACSAEREQLREIDRRLGVYLSPQLAGRLRAEPELGELGGTVRDVSVVFADLQGFTAFSEQASPTEVVELLNEYWGVAAPILLREHEGYIERFAGDAVMVVFNADRSARPPAPRRRCGTRAPGGHGAARGRPPGQAALPRRGQHRTGGDRERRNPRAKELHSDRRHDEPRLAAADLRRDRPGRDLSGHLPPAGPPAWRPFGCRRSS